MDIKSIYKEDNDIWGLSQTYKGIKFNPIKITEEKKYEVMNKLFGYPKSIIGREDPILHKMSYLKIILYVLPYCYKERDKDTTYHNELKELISMITDVDEKDIDFATTDIAHDGKIENLLLTMYIGEEAFTESEFDNIREIILLQNGSSTEYVEAYRQKLEEDLEFMYRDVEKYTKTDQIFALCSLFGKFPKDVINLTYFQMKSLLDSVSAIESYRMQVVPLTEVGDKYTFQHYMKRLKTKSRYSEILQTVGEFQANTDY